MAEHTKLWIGLLIASVIVLVFGGYLNSLGRPLLTPGGFDPIQGEPLIHPAEFNCKIDSSSCGPSLGVTEPVCDGTWFAICWFRNSLGDLDTRSAPCPGAVPAGAPQCECHHEEGNSKWQIIAQCDSNVRTKTTSWDAEGDDAVECYWLFDESGESEPSSHFECQ